MLSLVNERKGGLRTLGCHKGRFEGPLWGLHRLLERQVLAFTFAAGHLGRVGGGEEASLLRLLRFWRAMVETVQGSDRELPSLAEV